MADTKISALSDGSTIQATDQVPVNRGGVNARVVVTKAALGLGVVDNTSDAGKPVSTAQQTALDLKANLASPTFTGTPVAPTAAAATNTTQVATTAHVFAERTNAATLTTKTLTAPVIDQGLFVNAAAPATPAAGKVALYAKTDKLLYSKNDAGVETLVSGGSGGGGSGDVVGPASATDGNIVVFDGTTGKLIKNSSVAPIAAVTSSAGAADAGKLPALNGSGVLDSSFVSGVGSGNVSNTGTPTSSQIAEWTDSTHIQGVAVTGSGSVVRATSPTLVTPALGTPTAIVLTNGTALPASALVAGTLAAVVIGFGENTELQLDAALSADGKYCGITEVVTAGETIAFGEVVYLKAADSRWWRAKADADATAGAVRVGIAVTSGTAASAMTILAYGKIRADAKFPTLTVGAPVYISIATAGLVQTAQPSATDNVIRILGHANTADEMQFNPSNDYMTHT